MKPCNGIQDGILRGLGWLPFPHFNDGIGRPIDAAGAILLFVWPINYINIRWIYALTVAHAA
jgi:hypothetical protein